MVAASRSLVLRTCPERRWHAHVKTEERLTQDEMSATVEGLEFPSLVSHRAQPEVTATCGHTWPGTELIILK